MSNNKKRSNQKDNASRRRTGEFRKSYDTIPQPTGKFKDLFQQMQDKKNANKMRSTVKDEPSK